MSSKVSIIIPIFNSEQFLTECLESIAKQTMIDGLQVIMIDDGSTDGSAAICQSFVDKYKSFEYHYKKNGGPASARNLGLDYAMGEYVGFVDSDDWIDSNMYKAMYDTAKVYKADIVFSGVVAGENTRDDEYVRIRSGFYDRSQMVTEIFPYLLPSVKPNGYISSIRWANCLRIFRRDVIESNHIRSCEDSMRAEDLTFLFRCTLNAQSYYYLDSLCAYHNRARTESVSTKYVPDLWRGYRKVIKELTDAAKSCVEYDFTESLATTTFEFGIKSIENELNSHNAKVRFELNTIITDFCLQEAIGVMKNLKTCSFYSDIATLLLNQDLEGIIRYYKKSERYNKYILPLYQIYLNLRKAIKAK